MQTLATAYDSYEVRFIAMWTYLARVPALLVPEVGAEGARRARRAATIGPVVYGLSIALAFVSPVTCLIVYAAARALLRDLGHGGGRTEGGPVTNSR